MTFTTSVVLWGGNGPVTSHFAQDADPVGHVAIAVHETVFQPTTCHLHHARCPDSLRFIYESRPNQIFDADVPPRGRCDLRSDLSAADAERANQVLARFGADETHLPLYGEGNCQNWLAAAVGALEQEGLAQPGDGAVWTGLVGQGPRAMEKTWAKSGRDFVECEKFAQPPPKVVHARWTGGVGRPEVGRLEHNEAFGARIAALRSHMDERGRMEEKGFDA